MTNDSKATLQGNKTDQDQLTDDQLQAVSGGSFQSILDCFAAYLTNGLQQMQQQQGTEGGSGAQSGPAELFSQLLR